MAHSTNSTQTNQSFQRNDLLQFTGDIERYRHPLNPKIIYTPGVQYLAERARAYWLIDVIASYFGTRHMEQAMIQDEQLRTLQFWSLVVKDSRGVVIARADSNVEPFVVQEIPFTDFPFDDIDIWAGFDGEHWTLYLPSEH